MKGAWLKESRQALNLTVRQAVEAMGLSAASERKWRRWEKGVEDLPTGIADDWADLCAKHGIC